MPEVRVCRGKDCRKHAGTQKICDLLDRAAIPWRSVRCQKVCKAPVVGVQGDGPVVWYSKIRGRTARQRLVELIAGGKPKQLKRLEAKKRRGKLR